jgi:hypothetical protein
MSKSALNQLVCPVADKIQKIPAPDFQPDRCAAFEALRILVWPRFWGGTLLHDA